MVIVHKRQFVADLPDLIGFEEYPDHPEGGLVRLRVSVSESGISILGDAFRPEILEELLVALGADTIEQMLCG